MAASTQLETKVRHLDDTDDLTVFLTEQCHRPAVDRLAILRLLLGDLLVRPDFLVDQKLDLIELALEERTRVSEVEA